jgi:hypothetical protein
VSVPIIIIFLSKINRANINGRRSQARRKITERIKPEKVPKVLLSTAPAGPISAALPRLVTSVVLTRSAGFKKRRATMI